MKAAGAEPIRPGSIARGKALDPLVIQDILNKEIFLQQTLQGRDIPAIGKPDWEAMVWNARETIHLNRFQPQRGKLLNHFRIGQDAINFHLKHAYQFFAPAWSSCPYLPQRQRQPFLVKQADSFFAEARLRQQSLAKGRQFFRQFSVRQYRFHAFLAQIVVCCLPLMQTAAIKAPEEFRGHFPDLLWHAEELQRRFGDAESRPPLKQRMRIPFPENNHLLATAVVLSGRAIGLYPTN